MISILGIGLDISSQGLYPRGQGQELEPQGEGQGQDILFSRILEAKDNSRGQQH